MVAMSFIFIDIFAVMTQKYIAILRNFLIISYQSSQIFLQELIWFVDMLSTSLQLNENKFAA